MLGKPGIKEEKESNDGEEHDQRGQEHKGKEEEA